MNATGEHDVEVTVLGERELDAAAPQASRSRSRRDADRSALSLLAGIERCTDGAARQPLIHAALRKAGFQWLCYWRIQCVGELVRRAVCFDAYSPPGWLDDVRKAGLFGVDPRIGLACSRDWPVAWDFASLFGDRHASPPSSIARRFIEGAAKAGVNSGVTMGLSTRRPSERVVVTFSSARTDRRWVTDRTMGEAYALALAVHAFIGPRLRHAMPHPEPHALSGVQLAVLRLVSQGMSNREIAERLMVSDHVVAHHLRQLQYKCAARNRVQLAYVAGRVLRE